MIVRRHRFHGYGSLKTVYSRGQSIRGNLLSLRFVARSSGRPYRVAVVVSRKVNKSAVVRNRIRRRLYEIVRTHELEVPPGTDVVFTVFSDILEDMEHSKLEALAIELLQKTSQK